MNAQELADLLLKESKGGAGDLYAQAANMLRLQEVKIESLSKALELMSDQVKHLEQGLNTVLQLSKELVDR